MIITDKKLEKSIFISALALIMSLVLAFVFIASNYNNINTTIASAKMPLLARLS